MRVIVVTELSRRKANYCLSQRPQTSPQGKQRNEILETENWRQKLPITEFNDCGILAYKQYHFPHCLCCSLILCRYVIMLLSRYRCNNDC